jgi:hypothetical protein
MVVAILYLALGLVVTFGSLLHLVGDPQYWDAVTTIDYMAVWSWSLGFVSLAIAVPLLVHGAQVGRPASTASWVVAAGSTAAAIANALEDGFALKALGTLYVVGSVTVLVAMLALIIMLARAGRPRTATVIGLWFGGLALNTTGLGVVALVGSVLAIVWRDRLPAGWADSATIDGSQPSI